MRAIRTIHRPTCLAWALASSVLVANGVGCVPPPEAPRELSELTRYLYREWDNEDPRVLAQGVDNLYEILVAQDLEGSTSGRSFELADAEQADVDGVEHPDVPVEDCAPVAVAGRSAYGLEWHAKYISVVDQSPAEPSASAYERIFVDPEDPRCFVEGECTTQETLNHVTRSNPLYTVTFDLPKTFRWVDRTAEEETTGLRAVVARSWIRQSYVDEDGDSTMVQSFTLDVWIEEDAGTVVRYQALYAEMDIPGVESEDLIRAVSVDGIADAFKAADEAIAEAYDP